MAKKTKLKIAEILENRKNLAPLLRDNVLEEMGVDVCTNFDKDKQSRQEWEERSEEAMKLALQIAEEKTFPWPGAANVKYPLITLASIQFASRVELFSGNDVVRCKVVGYDSDGLKADRAVRLERHMTYQLVDQMSTWDEDNDTMMHALPIIGTMFRKTFYDPAVRHPESQLIWPTELVFDYWARNVTDCARKTHVLYLYPHKIEENMRRGLYRRIDLGEEVAGFDQGAITIVSQKADSVSLFEGRESYQDKMGARCVLEQHVMIDLDDDGYAEPYCITVDFSTQEVLRITPRFDEDSIEYTDNGKTIVAITPIEYFSQYIFIPDPNGGSLGVGFGNLQGPINEVLNSSINQLIDAGTQSLLGGGFIGSGMKMKAGSIELDPGEWKMVQSTGTDIKNNIVPLPQTSPSQVLFNLLGMLLEGGEKIGSITDALTGDNPPTNQPATTTLSVIEQGLAVFKKINKRLYKAYKKEFGLLFDLNKRTLPDQEYFSVLDLPVTQMQRLISQSQQMAKQSGMLAVLRSDYQVEKATVVPAADPSIMTKAERMVKAESLLQSAPVLGWPMEEVKKRYVEAMEFTNPEALLKPPPPPPPDPKIELEVQKLQFEKQKFQAEMQRNLMQAELDRGKQVIAARKTEMEISYLEAQIRQILAQISDTGSSEKLDLDTAKVHKDFQIELAKLELEKQRLEMELAVGVGELDLKTRQVHSQQQQTAVDAADKLKDFPLENIFPGLKTFLEEAKRPKDVKHSEKTGLIESIGNTYFERDKNGRVVMLVPKPS